MFVTLVHVKVREGHIEDFIRASTLNHRASIKEEGNLRFDVLQDREDPSCFILYEAYESKEAAAKHKETEHYLRWKETVAPWMAEALKGVPYDGLLP